jgi:hypothetical protein
MSVKLFRNRASQHGQGMLEYALIIFLVAAVAILGIVFLVPVILNGISGALPGL